jgi:hypothetical protein
MTNLRRGMGTTQSWRLISEKSCCGCVYRNKTAPERRDRGAKLLDQLQADAFEKMQLVTPQELAVPRSVDKFISTVKDKYASFEHHRVGEISALPLETLASSR